ncbi:peptidylprolyl isomerase [Wenyingzhuangia sp. chi5]|uniref:Peptidyl-prolyl cis-trans isomerase n=1 Tax=Wenyingzhuangia gilva TaxID=3057677 RepID=A0ABT8VRM4_9FLAO|nr:peptidylprolyl isomerase [Wenyingzhuangia sp. chi5]MDO3694621.1 peptidylprolyl isomerase [Wenyingzhuangia sp. chi5]
MPVLLSNIIKHTKYFTALFLTIMLMACGNNSSNKQATKKTTPPAPPKQEIVKKKTIIPVPRKDTMLVKDIINDKNVRKFFTEYGRKNPETKLLLKTRLGNMHITLFKETPLHRASFIYLIKNGYYNKTCFHRIVKNFIIQGGWSDTEIVQKYRSQLNDYRIPPEFRKGIIHKKGALSATRRWVNNPNKLSNPFEFFIMQTSVDCSHLNFEHTVFGQVTSGFDVIDKIIDQKLDGNSEWPEVDVDIEFVILD